MPKKDQEDDISLQLSECIGFELYKAKIKKEV